MSKNLTEVPEPSVKLIKLDELHTVRVIEEPKIVDKLVYKDVEVLRPVFKNVEISKPVFVDQKVEVTKIILNERDVTKEIQTAIRQSVHEITQSIIDKIVIEIRVPLKDVLKIREEV